MATDLEVVGEPRAVGETKNHLQFRLQQGDHLVKAIAWNLAEKGRELWPGHPAARSSSSRRSTSGTTAGKSSSRSRISRSIVNRISIRFGSGSPP